MNTTITYKTRNISIDLVDCDFRDWPDMTDAYIDSAVWLDSQRPFDDDELEDLNTWAEGRMCEWCMEHQILRADLAE